MIMFLSLVLVVEVLLVFLKSMKVLVYEIGLMLFMSLCFVLILMDDMMWIMNVQKVCGVDFGEGSIV